MFIFFFLTNFDHLFEILQAMLCGDFADGKSNIEIPDIDPDTFRTILRYTWTFRKYVIELMGCQVSQSKCNKTNARTETLDKHYPRR